MKIASVEIELKSHKYRLQAFKDELAREKHKAEKCGQQKYLWYQAAQELKDENWEQKHKLKMFNRKWQGLQEYYEYVLGKVDEGKRHLDEAHTALGKC